MGKIIYDPNGEKDKARNSVEVIRTGDKERAEVVQGDLRYQELIQNIDSVKPIGNTDCNYIMYLEDYVYTYIYQYAATDTSLEHAAVIIGEYYADTKETIICGIIPVSRDKLRRGEEWLNNEAIDDILAEKEQYFPGTTLLGWLHMQPGYGTMVTTREIKVQEELFNREGSLLLLVDPINKIETFYVYEQNDLKEQTGYYIYYDKNPSMQRYMLDNPFIMKDDKEKVDDSVVSKFRERGTKRKKEYEQKRTANITVVSACLGLLAIVAVIASRDQDPTSMVPAMADIQNNPSIVSQDQVESTPNTDIGFVITENNQVQPNLQDSIVSVEGLMDAVTEEAFDSEEQIVEAVIEEDDKESSQNSDNSEENSIIEATGDVEEAPQEDYIVYTVKSGDTLRKISYDHYQTELRTKEIIEINQIENGDLISPGQVLNLPAK